MLTASTKLDSNLGVERLRKAAAILFFILGPLYALKSGVLGAEAERHLDARFIYAYGAAIRDGVSPYNRVEYSRTWERELDTAIHPSAARGVALLPSMGPFAATWARLPWRVAGPVYDALNFCFGLGGTLYFIALLTRRALRLTSATPGLGLGLGAVCFIGGVPGALYVGQPTLWAMAGALGAIELAFQGRAWLTGLCVLAASLKAPVVLLPLFYLACLGYWRGLVVGAFLTLLFSVVTLLWIPLDAIVDNVRESLRGYAAVGDNQPPNVTGIPGLVGAAHAPPPSFPWLVLGMLLTAACAFRDRRAIRKGGAPELGPERLFAAFLFTGLFIPLKLYDLVVFGPLLCATLASGKSLRLLYLPGFLLIAKPERLLAALDGAAPVTAAQLATVGALSVCVVWAALRVADERHSRHKPGLKTTSTQ